ncbi:MAG: hypothetical protein JW867_03920 [Candidatus Omnitrophica bacterium]|nr:hypothetical protein [Candidatus Omnitrophota bacterium]
MIYRLRSFVFVILLSFVFLIGCAQMQWSHPSKTREIFYQEKLECEKMANDLAWQRYPKPMPNTNITLQQNVAVDNTSSGYEPPRYLDKSDDPDSYSRQSYRNGCLKECLYGKGWVYEEVKQ